MVDLTIEVDFLMQIKNWVIGPKFCLGAPSMSSSYRSRASFYIAWWATRLLMAGKK
jgi:hypothetical protein